MLQITEFLLHPTEIIVNRFSLQQTGLSKEESFHLCQVVTMLINGAERKQIRPGFKSISIQSETKITCQRDEKGVLPMLVAALKPPGYGLVLLIETLGL